MDRCVFCDLAQLNAKGEILAKFEHCYVKRDADPVSLGHLLIIPYEHTENWFTAREEVRLEMMKVLHFMKDQLDRELQPAGYNFGANCGAVAGQTVMHLHIHLIPRYSSDAVDPKGRIKGVMPIQ